MITADNELRQGQCALKAAFAELIDNVEYVPLVYALKVFKR